MGKTYGSILELIGRTPLVRLGRFEKHIGSRAAIYGKLEEWNPSGSVKVRIALSMVRGAEKDGRLGPGGTIIEGTNGNTGIGLALVASVLGYRTIICMPSNMSGERVILMRSYGTEVVLTPAIDGMHGTWEKAFELRDQIPGAVVMNQNENPDNPDAHFATTGPEIWEDLDGKVDVFIAGAGTGGTITGAGKFLRSKNPGVKIVAVEPKGSAILHGGAPGPHRIAGIGQETVPEVFDTGILDEVIDVSDEEAYAYTRLLPRIEGIEAGISSGAALAAAKQMALRPESAGKNIAVILPDGADRYLSGDLYRYEADELP